MRADQSMKTKFVGGCKWCVQETQERAHEGYVSLSGSCCPAEQVIWFLLSNKDCTEVCLEHLPRVDTVHKLLFILASISRKLLCCHVSTGRFHKKH